MNQPTLTWCRRNVQRQSPSSRNPPFRPLNQASLLRFVLAIPSGRQITHRCPGFLEVPSDSLHGAPPARAIARGLPPPRLKILPPILRLRSIIASIDGSGSCGFEWINVRGPTRARRRKSTRTSATPPHIPTRSTLSRVVPVHARVGFGRFISARCLYHAAGKPYSARAYISRRLANSFL